MPMHYFPGAHDAPEQSHGPVDDAEAAGAWRRAMRTLMETTPKEDDDHEH